MRRLTPQPSLLLLPITKMKIPATEYIPGVSQYCLKEWQDIWNCCEGNKLHAIYPNIGRIPHCKNLSRRNAVVINRLLYLAAYRCVVSVLTSNVAFLIFAVLVV